MNPDARVPGFNPTWEDLSKLPPGINLPEGVDKSKPKDWYVQGYTTADGRTFYEFYKRGNQPKNPDGTFPPDKVHATVEGPPNTDIKVKWEKDKEKAEKPDPTVSAPPNQPNIVSRGPDNTLVTEPNPNYTPPAGTAGDWHTEGRPDGQGGFDNGRPIMVRTVNGKRETRELTGKELEDWNLAQQMTRNPGGKTDADIATEQKEADARKRQQEQDERQRKQDELNAANQARTTATAAASEARQTATANRIPNPDVPGGFLERQPDGAWRPIKMEGVPSGALPSDAPAPSGLLGDAAADLLKYRTWLHSQVTAGKMTEAQADKHEASRLGYWTLRSKEQEATINAQRSKFNDDVAQLGQTLQDVASRRSSASGIANQATSSLWPLASKMGRTPGGGEKFMAALRHARNSAQDFVTLSGGNQQVAEIQPGPAYNAAGQAPLPGGAPGAAMPNLNVRPNAIGVGSAPGFMTPGAAPPSGAQVEAANQQTQSGFQNAVGPLVTPPADGAPQAMMAPSPYFLAGSSNGRAYDPTEAVQRLINDPRMSNDVVRQVVAEEFPGYPIDDLLRSVA